jgi:membrane associated rhomboid family serine protease
VSSPDAAVDDSVCYRHPDRPSWTLCQRCGRTICPECQILTPGGVRCPDCVRETGGSVRWEPAAGRPAAKRKKSGLQRRSVAQRVDSATRPAITIAVAATALVLWIAGFFASPSTVFGGAIFDALNARPTVAVQIWRYVTTSVSYPSIGGVYVLSVLLSIAIFVWIGWGAERFLGWRRYAVVLLVSGIAAAALSGIPLGSSIGLIGAVWGTFGAYLIALWDQPAARNRLLITMVIWFVFSLFFGNIVAVIGGAAGGIATILLLRRYDDRPNARPSTPYLLLAAGLAALVALAILSATVITPIS